MLISEDERSSGMEPPYRAKDMADIAMQPLFHCTKSKGSPRAIQTEVDTERSNALQKAGKNKSQLLKVGTSLGEELEGLTRNPRV